MVVASSCRTARAILRSRSVLLLGSQSIVRKAGLTHHYVGKMTPLSEQPLFRSLFTPEVTALVDVFKRHGHEIRFAGGPVRDLLSGKAPTDLDFATPATPTEMKAMFSSEGIRVINELGERHGTITARINDRENFEVTTLRIDRATDGRHAEVEFTQDWRLDAGRRDLTVNSMFLTMDGELFDFFGGEADLAGGRVTFVGKAADRIQEDYLRILRYFRFFGRIARSSEHEEETLESIRENVGGMDRISGERIWSEWKKILSGNMKGELTLEMIKVGLAPHIGLPEQPDSEEFSKVYQRCQERGIEVHPITLLAALLRSEEEMMELHGRLKLSGFERDLGLFVIANRGDRIHHVKLKPYQDLVVDNHKHKDCKEWTVEVLKYRGEAELASELEAWEVPRFPVTGHDLLNCGCPKGKSMSAVLTRLREAWKERDLACTKEELLELIPEMLEELERKGLLRVDGRKTKEGEEMWKTRKRKQKS